MPARIQDQRHIQRIKGENAGTEKELPQEQTEQTTIGQTSRPTAKWTTE